MQVGVSIDNKLLTSIDNLAKEQERSRSSFIVAAIESYLNPQPNKELSAEYENKLSKFQKDVGQHQTTITQLHHEIESKNILIEQLQNRMTELKSENMHLWGEYSKINDTVNRLLLPPPKQSIWVRLGLRRKK